ncbi:MAG: PfkB family carbohydrate kinase, partial [Pleomorphochaeta sp.]
KAIRIFRDAYDIDLIFLTLGRDGSKAYYKDICVSAPTFLEVKCVDTTGAGDSFMGCSMHKILEYGLNNLDKEKLKDTLIFANAGASLVASKKGVINSLPSYNDIKTLIN